MTGQIETSKRRVTYKLNGRLVYEANLVPGGWEVCRIGGPHKFTDGPLLATVGDVHQQMACMVVYDYYSQADRVPCRVQGGTA